MIPSTTKRLVLNPAPLLGEASGERPREERSDYSAAPPGVLEQRLRELEREWDVERLTAAVSSLLMLLAIGLVWLQGQQWLVYPAIVAGFLLLHALIGWSPAWPLIRCMGFRTSREIARERLALEAARGDAQTANLATTVQDREDFSRFENEGGGLSGIPEATASGASAGSEEDVAARH